jgi:hypothetical protein
MQTSGCIGEAQTFVIGKPFDLEVFWISCGRCDVNRVLIVKRSFIRRGLALYELGIPVKRGSARS